MGKNSPNMTFTEKEVRLPKKGKLQSTRTGTILPATKGPMLEPTLVTDENELIKIFGKPTDANAKQWFQCADHLRKDSALYIVRPMMPVWGNPTISLSPAVLDGTTLSVKDQTANMYNESEAEKTLEFNMDIGTDVIKIFNRDITNNNDVSIQIISKETDLTSYISDDVVENEFVRLLNSSGDIFCAYNDTTKDILPNIENYKHGDRFFLYTELEADNSTDTELSTKLKDVSTGTEVDIEPGHFVLATANKLENNFTYVDLGIADATRTGIISKEFYDATEKKFKKFEVDTLTEIGTIVVDSHIFNLTGSPILEISIQPNKFELVKDEDSMYYSHITKIYLTSNLYDNTKKPKTYSDVLTKKPDFDNYEFAVLVFKKTGGLYNLVEQHIGSYLFNSKSSTGLSNNMQSVINKESNLIYCKLKEDITEATNTSDYLLSTILYSVHQLNLIGNADHLYDEVITVRGEDEDSLNSNLIRLNSESLINAMNIFGKEGLFQPELLLGFDNRRRAGYLDTPLKIAKESGFSFAVTGLWSADDFIGKDENVMVDKAIDILGNEREDQSMGGVTEFNDWSYVSPQMKQMYDKYNDKFRWIPNVGDITGGLAEMDRKSFPWMAYAGINRGTYSNFKRLLFSPSSTNQNRLSNNGLNYVISDYDLNKDYFFEFLTNTQEDLITAEANIRRMIIALKHFLRATLKGNWFEFNDDVQRKKTLKRITDVFEFIKSNRGLYAYKLICDSSNNTPEMINSNTFVLDVIIQPTRTIRYIKVNLLNMDMGIDINEI